MTRKQKAAPDSGATSKSTTIGRNTMLKRMLLSAALVVALLLSITTSAFAYGQCGGQATSQSQLLSRWKSLGVTSQFAHTLKSAGYNSGDQSLSSWMRDRVVYVPQAQASRTSNFGCKLGRIFGVGPKTLPKGHMVFATLPSNLSKKDISLKRTKRFSHRRRVMGHIVADSGCSNGHQGVVYYIVYVPDKPKRPVKPHLLIAGQICSNQANGSNNNQFVDCSSNTCIGANACSVAPCPCSPSPPSPSPCPSGQVPAPGGGCKDSTQTPPTTTSPGPTPGPNPPPNGTPSDPGSNRCYDPATNDPVQPVWNPGAQTWDCPPGSMSK